MYNDTSLPAHNKGTNQLFILENYRNENRVPKLNILMTHFLLVCSTVTAHSLQMLLYNVFHVCHSLVVFMSLGLGLDLQLTSMQIQPLLIQDNGFYYLNF